MNPGPPELEANTWPLEAAGEALWLAACRAGTLSAKGTAALPRPGAAALAAPLELLPALAARLGLEATRQPLPAAAAGAILAGAELAALPVSGRLLVICRGRVLGPDGRLRRLAPLALRALAAAPQEAAARAAIAPFLEKSGLEPRAREAAAAALLEQELAELSLPAFELRLPPTAPLPALARAAGLPGAILGLLVLDLAALALFLLSWQVLGGALLEGGEPARLWPWALLLLTLVAVHRAARRREARLAIATGSLLKERLLAGALRLRPEVLLAEGPGGLLGKVLESEALEAALLGGGLTTLAALLELGGAFAVLLFAGLPAAAVTLLLAVLLAAVLLATAWPRLSAATAHRLAMTGNLVENLVGQRTRLAQLAEEEWHRAEDQELREHHRLMRRRDAAEWALLTLLPQGFLLAALLALLPAFLGDPVSAGALAAGLGAALLAQNALRRLAGAFWQLADAGAAWRAAAPLLEAAARPEPAPPAAPGLAPPVPSAMAEPDALLLAARQLHFTYPGSDHPVLRGASLELRRGDKVLLSGASGGGKSTLIGVLAGLRPPQSGLLLAGGLDLPTLGVAGFRRRLALAPQFHQNHVFTGPLTFNLLMGHPDPDDPAALEEAGAICRELGLEPLLTRMPAGLGEMVGETGWQLSHGERSRIFLARALLQRAPVVILDESLGALDPETFDLALDCLAKRAESLILVAHP